MMRMVMLLLVVGGAALAGCGDDDVGFEGDLVGGSCDTSHDCQYRCETGDHYPGGTCTLPCNVDDDCPAGTYCINHDDGVCLLACEVPADCRDGYSCRGEENRGTGGDSLVCYRD
jgi:hypothetical protein